MKIWMSGLGVIMALAALTGCMGYQNSWLHRQDVQTVYVEMIETTSFRRGYEFFLTDAICKRIEAQTPYKIVSDRSTADTILSGTATFGQGVLAGERWEGKPLEYETSVEATISWSNLKTGQVFVDRQIVYGAASYSAQTGQTFDYSIQVAINNAADKVVALMERPW